MAFDISGHFCLNNGVRAMVLTQGGTVHPGVLSQGNPTMTTKAKLAWTPLAFAGASEVILKAKARVEAIDEMLKPLLDERMRELAKIAVDFEPSYKSAGLIEKEHEMKVTRKFRTFAFASAPKEEKKATKAVSPADIKAFLAARK
jgi:hypothetical protein